MKHKLTNLDNDQIVRYSYDEENQSQRVTITNTEFGEAIKEAFSKIEFPKLDSPIPLTESKQSSEQIIYVDRIIKIPEIVEVQKNVFIPQIQIIEKPIIIKEIQTIKVPEYVTIHKTEVIEKPVIIKEYEKIPNLLKYCFYAFVCMEFINLIKSLVK